MSAEMIGPAGLEDSSFTPEVQGIDQVLQSIWEWNGLMPATVLGLVLLALGVALTGGNKSKRP